MLQIQATLGRGSFTAGLNNRAWSGMDASAARECGWCGLVQPASVRRKLFGRHNYERLVRLRFYGDSIRWLETRCGQ
jgi:hypothetical protein